MPRPECPVCYDRATCRAYPCRHSLCDTCLKTIGSTGGTCPLCRSIVKYVTLPSGINISYDAFKGNTDRNWLVDAKEDSETESELIADDMFRDPIIKRNIDEHFQEEDGLFDVWDEHVGVFNLTPDVCHHPRDMIIGVSGKTCYCAVCGKEMKVRAGSIGTFSSRQLGNG
jgi:hypothetical protein